MCTQKNSSVCMQSWLCIQLHAFQLSRSLHHWKAALMFTQVFILVSKTVFIIFYSSELLLLFVSHLQSWDCIYKQQTFFFLEFSAVCICCAKPFTFHIPLLHFKPRNGPLLQAAQWDMSHCKEANMLSSSWAPVNQQMDYTLSLWCIAFIYQFAECVL